MKNWYSLAKNEFRELRITSENNKTGGGAKYTISIANVSSYINYL